MVVSVSPTRATWGSRRIVARLTGSVRLVEGTRLDGAEALRNALRIGTVAGVQGATSRRAGEDGDDEGTEGDELNHAAESEHPGRSSAT